MSLRILHLSPHPDDEAIACPVILAALVRAGHKVVNLACSLGNPDQEERRREELETACERLGLQLLLPDPVPSIESSTDTTMAEEEVRRVLDSLTDHYHLFVSPSTHDLHPGHEAVARALRGFLREKEDAIWWQWSLWSDLPLPSLLYPFEKEEIDQAIYALKAHGGELKRNDYRRLVIGRAEANAILAAERVFGFGVSGIRESYAEVLSEVKRKEGGWYLGVPRILRAKDPLVSGKEEMLMREKAYLRGATKEEEWNLTPEITDWVEGQSLSEKLRADWLQEK